MLLSCQQQHVFLMGLFGLLRPLFANRQSCDSPIASTMSLDQAVAALLDLLAATEEPGFCWGPEELCAACQWGHTLQQLVDTPAGAAAVGQRLQVGAAAAAMPACVAFRWAAPSLPAALQTLTQTAIHCLAGSAASAASVAAGGPRRHRSAAPACPP